MDKKGSASVFLVIVLTAMIMLTAAFIYAAKQAAITSYSDGLLTLAGRSVLSEFDLELKKRYCLFAFEKKGEEVGAQIKEDMMYALQMNKDVKLGTIKVSFGEHSLGNREKLKEQILDYMKFAFAENLIKEKPLRNTEGRKDRTLRNRGVIENLPSTALKNSNPGFVEWVKDIKDKLGSIDQIFDKNKDAFMLDQYILLKFKNALGGQQDYSTFYGNEVEYILQGDFSNQKNKAEVRKGLVVLRSSLNAVHLYTDAEKRSMTLAAAEAITPGPAALVTQMILIGTWSLAEAENDALLLEKGRPVVLFKDKKSWATDLESILNNRAEGCIDTGSDKGLAYEDYLMIFLHFENEEMKMARVMDLIQINMKGDCRKDFLIKNYNCGLNIKADMNGRKYEYDTTY